MKEKMECFVPEIRIPEWLETYAEKLYGQPLPSPEERVRLTVEFAAENVRRGTGGPFAAALFDCEDRRLHSIGINVVLSSGQSFAHAEMTAIAAAQRKTGRIDLAGFELVSSCEPCVMCFGGILWSGVSALLYGAPGRMAAETGFDEGDKVPDWHNSLESRGIRVCGPLLGEAARKPFELYRKLGGVIY